MNDIQLRDLIRNRNGKIPIIFVTGERDHKLGVGFDGLRLSLDRYRFFALEICHFVSRNRNIIEL